MAKGSWEAAHRVEPPFAGDALELVAASVGELDTRSNDEVLYRARNDDTGAGFGIDDTGCDMDGKSSDVVSGDLDLSRMEPGADVDPQAGHGAL